MITLNKNHYIDLDTGEYREYESYVQTYSPEDDYDFTKSNDFNDYLKGKDDTDDEELDLLPVEEDDEIDEEGTTLE